MGKKARAVKILSSKELFAPMDEILEKGGRILELGCGIGSWTLEMSPAFSNSRFLGLDTSDLFPKWNSIPPNCRFQTHDIAAQPLMFPDAEFDHIFRGASAAAHTMAQWPVVLAEVYRVLKPGGYVEFVEVDLKVKGAGECTARWFDVYKTITANRSIDPCIFRRLPTLLSEADLTVTLEQTFNVPIGQWGGYIGESWARDLEVGIRGLRVAFMREGGMTGLEFDSLVEGLVDEYKRMRGGLNIHVVVAKKGGEK